MTSKTRPFDQENMRHIKFIVYEEGDGLVSVPYQQFKKDVRFGQLCLTLDNLFMPIIRMASLPEKPK